MKLTDELLERCVSLVINMNSIQYIHSYIAYPHLVRISTRTWQEQDLIREPYRIYVQNWHQRNSEWNVLQSQAQTGISILVMIWYKIQK